MQQGNMNTTKDRLFKDTVFIYAVRCAEVRCDCAGECGWTADMDSQSLNEEKKKARTVQSSGIGKQIIVQHRTVTVCMKDLQTPSVGCRGWPVVHMSHGPPHPITSLGSREQPQLELAQSAY